MLCVQGISPHAAEGTKRHGLCSLLLPALGPDRRPPALAPVAAPSQHHAPLPPNGIRARIWLADVLAAGTPISPPLSPCPCPLWPAGRGTICNGGNTRIGVYGQPINDSSGESPRTLRQRVPALRASPSSARAFGEDGLRPEMFMARAVETIVAAQLCKWRPALLAQDTLTQRGLCSHEPPGYVLFSPVGLAMRLLHPLLPPSHIHAAGDAARQQGHAKPSLSWGLSPVARCNSSELEFVALASWQPTCGTASNVPVFISSTRDA